MRRKKYIWFFLITTALAACGKTEYEEKKSMGGRPNYFVVRESIIKPQCVSCHPAFESHEELMKMVKPGKPTESNLYNIISRDEMPPTGRKVADEKKAYLKTWIEQGANL